MRCRSSPNVLLHDSWLRRYGFQSRLRTGEFEEHLNQRLAAGGLLQLIQRTAADEPAAVQQSEAIAQAFGFVELMRRQQHRLALRAGMGDELGDDLTG